ncbi:unnamed protein product, partial [Pleuronectes platessa]
MEVKQVVEVDTRRRQDVPPAPGINHPPEEDSDTDPIEDQMMWHDFPLKLGHTKVSEKKLLLVSQSFHSVNHVTQGSCPRIFSSFALRTLFLRHLLLTKRSEFTAQAEPRGSASDACSSHGFINLILPRFCQFQEVDDWDQSIRAGLSVVGASSLQQREFWEQVRGQKLRKKTTLPGTGALITGTQPQSSSTFTCVSLSSPGHLRPAGPHTLDTVLLWACSSPLAAAFIHIQTVVPSLFVSDEIISLSDDVASLRAHNEEVEVVQPGFPTLRASPHWLPIKETGPEAASLLTDDISEVKKKKSAHGWFEGDGELQTRAPSLH